MPSVLITGTVLATLDDAELGALQAAGWAVQFAAQGAGATEDDLLELLRGHDAVVAGGEPYTRQVMARSPTLRHIARWGVGFDRVDLQAATELGVLVTTAQGANDWAVADHTFALMLALAHGLVETDRGVRAGIWTRTVGADVWRKTLGLVGLGRIGQGVAQRAWGFEMKVLAVEPYPDRVFVERYEIELVSLEQLLRRSDFVSLHLPTSPKTRQVINADRLVLMKPTAYLINTARGSLIDEDSLYAALTEERLAGAGLDVREREPPSDDRFYGLSNVVMTSHVAGVTRETAAAMSRMCAQSILQATRGELPTGLLNPEAWETRRR